MRNKLLTFRFRFLQIIENLKLQRQETDLQEVTTTTEKWLMELRFKNFEKTMHSAESQKLKN